MKKILLSLSALIIISGAGFGLYAINAQRVQQNETKKSTEANVDNTTYYTREDMNKISTQLNNSQFIAPKPADDGLQDDIPSARVWDDSADKFAPLAVWDSWPVQKPDGSLANFHGYHLVVALTQKDGRDNKNPARMGLFSQKIGANQDDLNSWNFVGYLFDDKKEGISDKDYDEYMQRSVSEWSGSTYLMKDGDNKLRVFYANAFADKTDKDAVRQNLATAQVTVNPEDGKNWSSGLDIDHDKTTDRKTIFAGDGKIYQTAEQNGGKRGKFEDDLTLRDPHFVEDNGEYYLIFEGNTGDKYDPQGTNNFEHQRYFGSKSFYESELKKLKADPDQYDNAYFANGAIGKLTLNKDFTVKQIMKPMVVANAVNDELERVNLFKHDGQWYLFTTSWGFHMTTDNKDITNNAYMLGFSSTDGINGKFKPMNGNGTVLIGNGEQGKSNLMYAYLVLPNSSNSSNNFVVTAFEGAKTFAPSYLLKIKGDTTQVNNSKILGQGVLTDNGEYHKAVEQNLKR